MEAADTQDQELDSTPIESLPVVAGSEDSEACWVCGYPTEEIHCRIICPNCGFTRDCSDP